MFVLDREQRARALYDVHARHGGCARHAADAKSVTVRQAVVGSLGADARDIPPEELDHAIADLALRCVECAAPLGPDDRLAVREAPAIQYSVHLPTLHDKRKDFETLFAIHRGIPRGAPVLRFDFTPCTALDQNAVAFLGGLATSLEQGGTTVMFDCRSPTTARPSARAARPSRARPATSSDEFASAIRGMLAASRPKGSLAAGTA